MNNLQIIGNLTADPKEYSTKDGILCAKFTVAVNGYGESVEYIYVTAWRKTAENCLRYLKKGSKVFISGEATCRVWESQSGEAKGNIEVNARTIELLSQRTTSDDEEEEPKPRAKKAAVKEPKASRYQPSDDEELPF